MLKQATGMYAVLAFAVLMFSACGVPSCFSEEVNRSVSLTEEERTLIQEKIVHECSEKVFWVPSRQGPLKCAGKSVGAFGFFRTDAHVAEPVAFDQPFNILIVVPELRTGYKFARMGQGEIVLDGYLGWLASDKSQGPGEPTAEQYWDRVRQRFPEFFSGEAVEKWEFTAQFPELQQIDFGPLDDWKKRELDKIQAAVAENISRYPPRAGEQQPGANAHREKITLLIGEFSRWSGYVYVVVPELNTLLTIPFALSPLGSEYPVEADSAKQTPLDKANPDLVQRIRTHGFERKITIPQRSPI